MFNKKIIVFFVAFLGLGLVLTANAQEKTMDRALGQVKNTPQKHQQEKPPQGSAADKLRQQLVALQTLKASFTQKMIADNGDVLQTQTGVLSLSKPGKVRLQTAAPYEQLVVSDGETLWLYDPDLEQVTIRKFQEDVSHTPAVLFIGDLNNLENVYEVTIAQAPDGNRVTYTLFPKAVDNSDSFYEKLSFSFQGKTPVGMSLWDHLGQQTQLVFTEIQQNIQLKDDLFQFDIPANVDVLRESASPQ